MSEPYLGNHKSAKFFAGLGYTDIGHRWDPAEGDFMVREVDMLPDDVNPIGDNIIVVETPWIFGISHTAHSLDKARDQLTRSSIGIEGNQITLPPKRVA